MTFKEWWKPCICSVVTISKRIKKYQNVLAKNVNDEFIGMNIIGIGKKILQ